MALPDLSAHELQELLAHRRDSVKALRSEATVAISSPERSGTARQFLLVRRPDRLRVEVFSPFGTAFALATAGGELAAYVRDENRVYRGAASPPNLARYAGIDLDVADVVALLLGSAPQRQVLSASVLPEPATGRLRLRQEVSGGAQVVSFAGDTLLPVFLEELDAEGQAHWRATFSSYRSSGGVGLPTRIAVELPAAQQSVDITLIDPEANPSLPDALFSLPTPPGSAEVRL